METIYLKPGELYCSKTPALIRTVIDSGISIFIWDQNLQIGGVGHFSFPDVAEGEQDTRSNRYGVYSIPNLLRKLKSIGACKENLTVRILGGCETQSNGHQPSAEIGQRNAAVATEILNVFGVKLTGRNVGGRQRRKAEFNTASGELKFKKINS